ncbi:type II restriction endonuclease subunit M [Corynebacterium sp. 13CS0277]|uniref:type II restriction endonuclease subunit M n=1 Tax=Corynebacterium sp. 13CS0277 TaxID=2071994 RepID=UPI0011B1DDA3|nr:type II restriction endonuclease subunit M [Corynebacterium sp. 13CS0277]
MSALIHSESHFTEAGAIVLRKSAYQRLKRHFHFVNELRLFDIHNLVPYGVHVYGSPDGDLRFLNASNLYHPSTASASFFHDGSGDLPSFKDDNGNWDLRPHKDRIQVVDEEVVGGWGLTLSGHEEPTSSCMVYQTTSALSEVLAKMARTERMESLDLHYSTGWNETNDRARGVFEVGWNRPERWEDVILQGPHILPMHPFAQEPNKTLRNNRDYSPMPVGRYLQGDLPACGYKYLLSEKSKIARSKHFSRTSSTGKYSALEYRVAWRTMVSKNGFRTLINGVIPPGPMHVHTLTSAGAGAGTEAVWKILLVSGLCSSYLVDFFIRSIVNKHVLPSLFEQIPIGRDVFSREIAMRAAALNCTTLAHSSLLKVTGVDPIIEPEARKRAMAELDVLVAHRFNVSIDELEKIYDSAFPVQRKYDQKDGIDYAGLLRSAMARI